MYIDEYQNSHRREDFYFAQIALEIRLANPKFKRKKYSLRDFLFKVKRKSGPREVPQTEEEKKAYIRESKRGWKMLAKAWAADVEAKKKAKENRNDKLTGNTGRLPNRQK